MPTPEEIVTFRDDTEVPPGESPWVAGHEPVESAVVVEPDPAWPAAYDALAERVRRALGPRVLALEHVGSTAVPGLPAKAVIDLDLVVADPDDEAAYVAALQALGLELRVREPWWYGHRCFRGREPVCNLHVFGPDAAEPVRHRLFRDWLRVCPADRDLYARVKQEAAAAAVAAGEHTMQYNARKQVVVREIYQRAFAAAGLLDGTTGG